MRDQMNDIHPAGASVVTGSDNTATVGQIADTKGYDALTFLIGMGTLADADATYTVLVEDGDDSGLSDAAAVADEFLVGTEALAGFDFSDDNGCRKIGYVGPKRYARCTVTPANNTGSSPIAIINLLGCPDDRPTANPPT